MSSIVYRSEGAVILAGFLYVLCLIPWPLEVASSRQHVFFLFGLCTASDAGIAELMLSCRWRRPKSALAFLLLLASQLWLLCLSLYASSCLPHWTWNSPATTWSAGLVWWLWLWLRELLLQWRSSSSSYPSLARSSPERCHDVNSSVSHVHYLILKDWQKRVQCFKYSMSIHAWEFRCVNSCIGCGCQWLYFGTTVCIKTVDGSS